MSEPGPHTPSNEPPPPPPSPAPPPRRVQLLAAATILLGVLVAMAALYTLYFAQSLLLPLVLAVLLNFLFSPVIRRLHRWGVPRAISALLVVTVLAAAVAVTAYRFGGPALAYVETLPAKLREVEYKLRDVVEPVKKMREAAEKVEDLTAGTINGDVIEEEEQEELTPQQRADRAASQRTAIEEAGGLPLPDAAFDTASDNADAGEAPPPHSADDADDDPSGGDPDADSAADEEQDGEDAAEGEGEPQTVTIRGPGIVETSFGYARSVGWGGLIVIVLLLFLLASNDLFMRKLVNVLPRYEDKWQTVEVMRAIEHDVSTYLLTVTLINIGLGAATAALLWLLGMPTPILWGVMVAVFNFVPYLGSLVSVMILALVAIIEFDTLGQAILAPAGFLLLNTLEAYVITPLTLGKRLSLNAVAVFIALVFWGWIWGVAGAILAVPMLVTMKIIAEHIRVLRPLAEFLEADVKEGKEEAA